MKLKRIAFQSNVPNPGTYQFAYSYWLRDFAVPTYEIVQAGDIVIVTHVESNRSYVYPWTHVAGAEPELHPTEYQVVEYDPSGPLPVAPAKRGKR